MEIGITAIGIGIYLADGLPSMMAREEQKAVVAEKANDMCYMLLQKVLPEHIRRTQWNDMIPKNPPPKPLRERGNASS